jgi:hypothetical protein
MEGLMKGRLWVFVLVLILFVSCTEKSNHDYPLDCKPPDINKRPTWVSNPPPCDNKFCYYQGMSEEKMTSEKQARKSAGTAVFMNLLKDHGIEGKFDNEILNKAEKISISQAINPVQSWETYQLKQVKRLLETSHIQKWYPEIHQSCEYDKRGTVFYKVFALLRVEKNSLDMLEKWRRNQVVYRLIEDSKRLESSRQIQKALELLRKANNELQALPTDYNPLWLSEISNSEKRIGRHSLGGDDKCDPSVGCPPEKHENVFQDRRNINYWITEQGEKKWIKVIKARSSGRKPTRDDFVKGTIKYYYKVRGIYITYHYRIQKHMMSRGNVGLDGRRTDVLTRTLIKDADDYCIQLGEDLFGEPMQVAQLYQFEHALRQQKIRYNPKIETEMVDIPDADPERGHLILTNDNFPFRSSYIKMLLFNWRSLTYSTALQTERGEFGFRCMREESFDAQE